MFPTSRIKQRHPLCSRPARTHGPTVVRWGAAHEPPSEGAALWIPISSPPKGHPEPFVRGEVLRGEKMLLSGTEPELCITEHNFVYEENRAVALTSQYGLVLTRLIDAELYCPDA